MSPPQKRFLRMHFLTEGRSGQLLFDYVNNMDRYDEEKVKEGLKQGKVAKNLKVHKSQLVETILTSLTVQRSFQKGTHRSAFYFNRAKLSLLEETGQHELLYSRWRKLHDFATNEHMQFHEIDLNAVLMNLDLKTGKLREHQALKIYARHLKMLERKKQLLSYKLYQAEIFAITYKVQNLFLLPAEEHEGELDKWWADLEALVIEDSSIDKGQRHELRLQKLVAESLLLEQLGRKLDASKKLNEIKRRCLEFGTRNKQGIWFVAMVRSLGIAVELGNYQDVDKDVEKLEAAAHEEPSMKPSLIFPYTYLLQSLQKRGLASRVIELVNKIEKFINQYTKRSDSFLPNLYCCMAWAYFHAERYEECRAKIKAAEKTRLGNPARDLRGIRLLSITTHYCVGRKSSLRRRVKRLGEAKNADSFLIDYAEALWAGTAAPVSTRDAVFKAFLRRASREPRSESARLFFSLHLDKFLRKEISGKKDKFFR